MTTVVFAIRIQVDLVLGSFGSLGQLLHGDEEFNRVTMLDVDGPVRGE